MAEQIIPEDGTSLMVNQDGIYSAVPYQTGDNNQLYVTLNELGIQNDGEEMVLIAADENLDMATLESLIASGAVTTVTGENGAEYVQVTRVFLRYFF